MLCPGFVGKSRALSGRVNSLKRDRHDNCLLRCSRQRCIDVCKLNLYAGMCVTRKRERERERARERERERENERVNICALACVKLHLDMCADVGHVKREEGKRNVALLRG